MQPQDNDDSSIQRPQTPPNQSSLPNQPPHEAPQYKSTPRKSGTPRSTTNVTAHRAEVLNQMKDEMVRCDEWSEGFDLYLPASGIVDADVNAAVKALKKKKFLREVKGGEQKLQFKAFTTNPSQIVTTNEKTCYMPLTNICKVLRGIKVESGREASCKLVQKPNSLSSGETKGANFIPDAYLKLIKSTMPALDTSSTKGHIADMAVPSEYKRSEGELLDNRKKLLGAATFCMNDDPRRMHIYGITIEDSKMSVWYFSRSHSAKSPTFDFTKDPRRYIRVMLSFLFANKFELGYDPTIQRRLDSDPRLGKQICYVYRVADNPTESGRYFKTQEAIFEHRSLCATGRATRVWKVVEVPSFNNLTPLGGSSSVLKDVWLDSESKTECQNLEAIFVKLKDLADLLDAGNDTSGIFDGFEEKEKNKLKECLRRRSWNRFFLSKVCDGQGFESKEVPLAAKPDSTLFDPRTSTPAPSSNPYSDASRSTITRATDLVEVAQNRRLRHYRPKRQYRVVFKEVCEALHDVQRLEDVVTALEGSVFALQLMFLAGWVHRDISSGNIYAYRSQVNGTDEVRGILADLEYAQQFDPEGAEGSSDPKTGTAFFMAIEIQKQDLIYNPIDEWKKPRRGQGVPRPHPQTLTGVIHNYEHDMESIFWLFLWTLLVRFPPERSADDEKIFAGVVSSIFQDTSLCPQERARAFTRLGILSTIVERWLNPDLQPIYEPLMALHRALVVGYHEREYNFSDRASYAELYHFLSEALESARIGVEAKKSERLTDSSEVCLSAQVVIKRKRSSTGIDVADDNRVFSKARVESSTDAASSQTLHHQNPEVEEVEDSS